ncbi:3229_t:CDS:2 [Acaulospora morrowiae]|uniref:3229_t:CDS:1 n=1 Tax=Acaulospora morrowiae TaxID=94023 RepID=A0A9N9GX73_9GLOM|nr:3229_t:CDS:2 [Acaulospora morrowiae]
MVFLRKLARSRPSFHFSLFPRFLSYVRSSDTLEIYSTGSFDDLRREGCYYLDKTHFISKIEALRAPAILSLRPRSFGKTLFLSTLSSYYDIKNRERSEQLFGDLYIGKNPTKLASSFLVLKFNFIGLRTNSTFEIFEENFNTGLNRFMSRFMNRYRQELGEYFRTVCINKDPLDNFMMLLEVVQLSDRKLYVCIDEYDACMNEALKNETLLQSLNAYNNSSVQSKVEKIESSFKQFYGLLKYACDEGIARIFQTGVTPLVLTEFNISKDLALIEEFWDMYGFKKSEIEFLLDKAFGNRLSANIKEEIMSWLKEENDGYFFHRDQPEGIFNTARVLHCITGLMEGMKKFDGNWDPLVALDTLLDIPSPYRGTQSTPSRI